MKKIFAATLFASVLAVVPALAQDRHEDMHEGGSGMGHRHHHGMDYRGMDHDYYHHHHHHNHMIEHMMEHTHM